MNDTSVRTSLAYSQTGSKKFALLPSATAQHMAATIYCPELILICGPPGTGKTHFAREIAGQDCYEAHPSPGGTHRWLRGCDTLLFDELSPREANEFFASLGIGCKERVARRRFERLCKGGLAACLPRRVILISMYSLEQLFPVNRWPLLRLDRHSHIIYIARTAGFNVYNIGWLWEWANVKPTLPV